MSGIGKLFKQAKFVKENYSAISAIQEQMKKTEVAGTAGRGDVTVVMDGSNAVKSVSINPSLIQPAGQQKLERLLVEAFNDAQNKSRKAMEGTFRSMTSGLNLDALKDIM